MRLTTSLIKSFVENLIRKRIVEEAKVHRAVVPLMIVYI
jgi:hypothetical protein